MGGISGFLLVFPGVIALTHEWTDFVRRLVAVRCQLVRFISRCKLPHTFFYSWRKKLVKSYPIHFSTVNEPATWFGRLVGKVWGAVSPFWMTVPETYH